MNYLAFCFFREHAGYASGPRSGPATGAIALARAEAAAARLGWSYDWQWDDQPWDGDCPPPRLGPLGCVARDGKGRVVASLWGIGLSGENDPYRRVIEAELALEAGATECNPCS